MLSPTSGSLRPAGRGRARPELPARRAAGHAARPDGRRDGRGPAWTDERGRPGRRVLRVRRGAAQPPRRPQDRGARKAKPFATTGDWRTGAALRAAVGAAASTRRRGCSRRCGSRSTTNWAALDRLLAQLPRVVKPGGRVGIISFHSLEDRRVKHAFRDRTVGAADEEAGEAGDDEVRDNPRWWSPRSLRYRRRWWHPCRPTRPAHILAAVTCAPTPAEARGPLACVPAAPEMCSDSGRRRAGLLRAAGTGTSTSKPRRARRAPSRWPAAAPKPHDPKPAPPKSLTSAADQPVKVDPSPGMCRSSRTSACPLTSRGRRRTRPTRPRPRASRAHQPRRSRSRPGAEPTRRTSPSCRWRSSSRPPTRRSRRPTAMPRSGHRQDRPASPASSCRSRRPAGRPGLLSVGTGPVALNVASPSVAGFFLSVGGSLTSGIGGGAMSGGSLSPPVGFLSAGGLMSGGRTGAGAVSVLSAVGTLMSMGGLMSGMTGTSGVGGSTFTGWIGGRVMSESILRRGRLRVVGLRGGDGRRLGVRRARRGFDVLVPVPAAGRGQPERRPGSGRASGAAGRRPRSAGPRPGWGRRPRRPGRATALLSTGLPPMPASLRHAASHSGPAGCPAPRPRPPSPASSSPAPRPRGPGRPASPAGPPASGS